MLQFRAFWFPGDCALPHREWAACVSREPQGGLATQKSWCDEGCRGHEGPRLGAPESRFR